MITDFSVSQYNSVKALFILHHAACRFGKVTPHWRREEAHDLLLPKGSTLFLSPYPSGSTRKTPPGLRASPFIPKLPEALAPLPNRPITFSSKQTWSSRMNLRQTQCSPSRCGIIIREKESGWHDQEKAEIEEVDKL